MARSDVDRATQERAKLLSTIAQVANLLLRSPDYITVFPEVVRLLGKAVGSDRCVITQDVIHPDSGQPAVRKLMEWCQKGIIHSEQTVPDLQIALEWDNLPEFREKFLQGESANFLIDQLQAPSRTVLSRQGVTSILVVPIMIGEQPWGQIGFDNCGEAKLYDQAEIAILKIAADSIAAAIERQAKDEELLKAEQARSQQLAALNAELQQALDRLSESETRFRELFETSNDGIHFVDFQQPIPLSLPIEEQIDLLYQGYLKDLNVAYAKMNGFTHLEEMIGKRLCEIHSPDSNHRLLLRQLIQNNWTIKNVESDDIDEAGNKRYWLSHLFATIENGYALRGWGIANNITEFKQMQQALLQAEQARSQELERLNIELQQAIAQLSESEERYRNLFRISSEGIYRFEFHPPIALSLPIDEQVELVHQNCYIAEGNQTYVEMYNLASPEEFSGIWLRDVHVADSDKNHTFLRTAVENRYQVRNYESEEVDFRGNPRYFLNNVTTLLKDGYAIGGWGSQLDITELRLTQQALLQAEQQRAAELAAANAALQTEVIARRQAEQVSRGQTEALVNTLNTLAREPVFDHCLGYMLQAIADQLSDRSGGIYLYNETYETTLLQINYENGQIQRGQDIQHPCAHTPEPLHQWDDEYMPLLKQRQILIQDVGHYPHNKKRGIKQILVVPLLFGNTFLGNITLRSNQYRQYQPEELELAQTLAYQVTLTVQLMQLAQQSQHDAQQAAILAERNRFAREIHDTLAQCLTGIIVQVQAATDEHTVNPSDQQAHLTQAIALAKNGLTEARRSVQALRPRSLETASLETALDQIIQEMVIGTVLQPQYRLVGIPYPLVPSVEDHLLRIVQEALTNVLRHANATQVEIELNYQLDQLQLQIKDNGQGFEPNRSQSKGYGLIGVQERVAQMSAQLTIASQPGQGTSIAVIVPILPPNRSSV
jgi:signal transduction histidine kinase/PAS domain-containing protein